MLLASVASIAAAVAIRCWAGGLSGSWVPALLLAVSAILLHVQRVEVQLVVRGVWCANLVLGTLVSVASPSAEWLGLALALSSGFALLVLGRVGLDGRGVVLQPVALRTALTFSLILGIADVETLLFFAVSRATEFGRLDRMSGLLLGSAAIGALAITGLVRLRGWGLLLSAFVSAGILTLSVTGTYGLPALLVVPFVASCVVQLALLVPVFVAVARRRTPVQTVAVNLLARIAPVVLVGVLMVVSTYATFAMK
ncbi:MAG: hypothetical protein U0414_32305 [Polyangiaceae bacterium]